jgi:hypothetical protein
MSERTNDELIAFLDEIRAAPRDVGVVAHLVSRPGVGERVVHDSVELRPDVGLVGDTWSVRPTRATGAPDPDAQLNIMSVRAAAAIAGDEWALAGDQLFLDLDLSTANLPAGSRLALGTALVEVTAKPHTGCAKFSSRFGRDALRFVNSPDGRSLNLRGICARVVEGGTVRVGDDVRALRASTQ